MASALKKLVKEPPTKDDINRAVMLLALRAGSAKALITKLRRRDTTPRIT
jgi:hypothetical protein